MGMFELVAKQEHLRSKGLLIVLHHHTDTTIGVKAVIFQKHNCDVCLSSGCIISIISTAADGRKNLFSQCFNFKWQQAPLI